MNQLTDNLAAAWKDRADREAAIQSPGLVKPEELDRSMDDFRRAVAWYRYWAGIGAS